VWGAHERCDLEAMKHVARPFFPPRPPDAPPDPDLSQPGELEALAAQAGLSPESEFDTTWAFEFPDAEMLGRAMVAVAGLAAIVGPEREPELKQAIVDGRLADDPWASSEQLHTVSIEPWKLLVGAERLASAAGAHAIRSV